jgi:transposase
MAVPVALRRDYDGTALRVLARTSKDGPQTRRLLALAAIYEGASRTEAARIGAVTLQIVRDWVIKFNAQGPAGLVDRKPPGQPALLSDAHRQQLAAMLEAGPIPAVHGVVRWRLVDLIQWLWEEHRIAISKQTLSRAPWTTASSRRDPATTPRTRSGTSCSKDFPARLKEIADGAAHGKPIEIWFCDEARVGQKNTISRRWAKRGSRPSAPRDQRTQSASIFGAICPAEGKGAGLVLPRCTTESMSLHLAEIAPAVAPGAHAVVLLD